MGRVHNTGADIVSIAALVVYAHLGRVRDIQFARRSAGRHRLADEDWANGGSHSRDFESLGQWYGGDFSPRARDSFSAIMGLVLLAVP
jgi:hypothetical protein